MSRIFCNSNLFKHYLNQANQETFERGYNILDNYNQIDDPQKFKIRKNVCIINITTELLKKILNKEDLIQNDIIICENSGKGNCFYKTLSQFYTNKEVYHIYYRKETCKSIENIKELDKQNYLFIYVDNFTTLSYEDYLNNMI